MEHNGLLSVILPAYNEESNILRTTEIISNILCSSKIPYELLFVDDGSSDKTWPMIQQASKTYPSIRGLHFSRNFGKESAIYAGLCCSNAACCAVLDCDLQHPPERLVEMYHLWQNGFDIVEGIKANRGKESAFHSWAAKRFYSIISKATKMDMRYTSDYKLLDQDVVLILKHMPERNAFFRALSSWVAFKSTSVEYDVQERLNGESKWSTKKLIKYALTNISSFTTAPMQIVSILGILMFIVGLIFGITAIIQKCNGIALPGFTTVIILQLFIGAIIMVSLGIIGYYISKIFDESKHRPRYIISEACGENNENIKTVG